MHRLGLLACASLLLGAAAPDLPVPTRAEIDAFLKPEQFWDRPESDPLFTWNRELKQALAASTPDQAADALAPRYGLAQRDMRELVGLWLVGRIHKYDFQRKDGLNDRLRARLFALMTTTRRNPLVLTAAASVILPSDPESATESSSDCDPADYDALLHGATDRTDGWRIAQERDCEGWYRKFVAANPDLAAPAVVRIAQGGSLDADLALSLNAWLVGDAGLSRFSEADREPLALRLYDRYLDLLFRSGLTARALAILDGLRPAFRDRLLGQDWPAGEAHGDGLAFRLAESEKDDSLRLAYAAALALAGRKEEAEAQFAALEDVAAARAYLACAQADSAPPARESRACSEDRRRDNANTLLLDQLLHHPADDPYPLAETFFSTSSGSTSSRGVLGELQCRVFADPMFADICESGRWLTAAELSRESNGYREVERADARAVVDAARLPGLDTIRADFASDLAAVVERGGGEAAMHRYDRATRFEAPAPPPFDQRPLPAAYRGRAAPSGAMPKGLSALPDGFAPVRFERTGNRLVVVSVSQNLDPTGEVSSGGYWVHLSEDGGRSWQAPLYTGLAEFFPYVVAGKSPMPLLDGDALDLAVEVAELDPASITYPPVGLRTKRREKDLYLRIPLAELRRDTDGDGLTDIAAAHLLLDPAGKAVPGATPFVVGASTAGCAGAPDPERQATMALLAKIFSVRTGAIVEPVDRAPDAPLLSGWRSAPTSWDRPIFVQGNPEDYACMHPDRLMIVYGEADMARLRRFAPDFHAVTLDKVVYNRARDRGYLKWSGGWNGGTIRLRRQGGAWTLDTISSWIT